MRGSFGLARLFPACRRGWSAVAISLFSLQAVWADGSGTIQYTVRFDGGTGVVKEVEWTYDRSLPSLTFSEPRVIWTGAGAPQEMAGSDGLFHTPNEDLVVGNWQAGMFWKFDPTKTDEVVDGPTNGAFPFHSLLHPNLNDFLATPAFGQIACNGGTVGCFGIFDHTPLTTSHLCLAPAESASGDILQPHTFIADENLNLFTLFSDGRDIQFGGAGFASFDLDTTTSSSCSQNMSMTRLIPQVIESAHSMSWSPYLSDANDPQDPHSDFILFANSRIAHVRVDDPGAPGATAELVSTIDMATESTCDSLLPSADAEFDQGAVNGTGIALVADEHTGWVALVDFSENDNGTILDPGNTVCLTAFLDEGIDDIAPITGLGAKSFFGDAAPIEINAGLSGGWFEPATSGQGFFIDITPSASFVFVSWFTYTDADSPNPNEQHWYTLQGNYQGNSAELIISETLGGEFDAPQAPATNPVGTATLVFFSCDRGELRFRFDDGREGVVPIRRVIAGSDNVCEDLADTSLQAVNINAGMDGSWFEPATSGQGLFFDVHPNAQGGGFFFGAWFTYGGDTASGQQWYTVQGNYAAGSMVGIPIYETTGGSFDDPQAVTTAQRGTVDISFTDCNNAVFAYDFQGQAGAEGSINLTRVVQAGGALCESLTR
jgi:hypothetical protein